MQSSTPQNCPTSIGAHHQRPPHKLQPGLEPLSNTPKLVLFDTRLVPGVQVVLSSCFLPPFAMNKTAPVEEWNS